MTTLHQPAPPRWRPTSLALILLFWAVLQIGGLFTPGLLDDVDSIYIQIAREMLQRHDFVTPTIDGVRFFDKPPLMYWLAAASMRLFGPHDWAARLPLALGVLALLFAVYALANRLYAPTPKTPGAPLSAQPAGVPDERSLLGGVVKRWVGRQQTPGAPFMTRFLRHEWASQTDRPGLYAALILATSLGPYLYTRFYIPDILIALWMTLSVHLFLIAMDRIEGYGLQPVQKTPAEKAGALAPEGKPAPSPLLPALAFAAVTALNLLTKGLIGVIFPVAFVLLYLALTRNLKALLKLHLPAATAVFLAIAAPWHILAALRNPAIAMHSGLGLPARAGWAWFYLYNEHIARFLGRRIPHDYGQVPVPLFWLLLLLWLLPWVAFLPAALLNAVRELRTPHTAPHTPGAPDPASGTWASTNAGVPFMTRFLRHEWGTPASHPNRRRQAALALLLWPAIILGFFTLSSRQEYYHLPALPALAILVAGLLAAADTQPNTTSDKAPAVRAGLRGSLYLLVPLGSLLFLLCAYFALTAPTPAPGATLSDLLNSNPANYNLSLGHLYDLTGAAMGFFRGPLWTVALGMLTLGPVAYLVRRRGHTFAANLLIAAAMTAVLLAAHAGLVRFYPILGSKDLALRIESVRRPDDLVLIDGELTAGSTLLFYTTAPAPNTLLVNGRINGPWFGSFWPDSPPIFLNDADLHRLWSGPRRIFLLTYHPADRSTDLHPFGPVHTFATSGDKTILSNH